MEDNPSEQVLAYNGIDRFELRKKIAGRYQSAWPGWRRLKTTKARWERVNVPER